MAMVIRGTIECSRPDGTRTVLVDGRPLGALGSKGAGTFAGTFRARLFLIGGPPDNDGDVIFDANEGRRIHLSVKEHDLIHDPTLEPAGEAILRQEGNGVVAEGRAFDTERGQRLREHLVAKGHRSEWSVGFVVTDGRDPTPEQRRAWPDVKRMIYGWDVFEASVVTRGACGPSCRTLEAKTKSCGCGCSCTSTSDDDLRDLMAKAQRTVETATLRRLAWDHAERQHQFETEDCAWLVSDDTRRRAKRIVAFGAKRLGVPLVPHVAWRDLRDAWGLWTPARPLEISLSVDLPSEQLPRTIGHELDHYSAALYERPQSEAHADAVGSALASAWAAEYPDEA